MVGPMIKPAQQSRSQYIYFSKASERNMNNQSQMMALAPIPLQHQCKSVLAPAVSQTSRAGGGYSLGEHYWMPPV